MLNRYAIRRDANHFTVMQAFMRLCPEVFDASSMGRDFPDLVVLDQGGRVRLVEIKTKSGRLSRGQKRFAKLWPSFVVRSAQEAEALVQKWAEEA